MAYSIPAGTTEVTLEVKKSLFHARASLAINREQAFEVLNDCKRQYPDARHHCWAYILGPTTAPTSAAMNDDGEPSGTAGKPILNVLQHSELGDIVVVVSRYFGGVKLGAGGLVRAYSAAAQQALDALPTEQHICMRTLLVESDFKHEQYIRHCVTSLKGVVSSVNYSSSVIMELNIPDALYTEFKASMANIQARLIGPS